MNKSYFLKIKYLFLIFLIFFIFNYIELNNFTILIKNNINKNISYIQNNVYFTDKEKKNKNTSLFEKKKYNIGDIITIFIKEKHIISNNDTKDDDNTHKKKINFTTQIPKYFTNHTNIDELNIINYDILNTKQDIKKKNFLEKEYFSSIIPATIKSILKNDYLFIEGKKTKNINGKITEISISGIVDPLCIDENNSILSNKVYNLNVQYNTTYTTNIFNTISILKNIINYILDILY
ncbi:flagellar basal body L-ring protein FlgH [Buchnera aphidicola (Mollitrichosiphum nigrofasciatum)]|uniref:flagellar basal body L-ring protein FlgH n=1 Tax=Buchnera aphidicola TaxID=9 RepID=UPI0031B8B21E